MQNYIREKSIIIVFPEWNEKINSINIQLKTKAEISGCLFSVEKSSECVLKSIKENNKISGIIINVDGSIFTNMKKNQEKNLALEIRKINLSLPIFLIRNNAIISLSPYDGKKIMQENHCKCEKIDINLESAIFTSIDHYIKNSITSTQTLPEESPVSLSTCFSISSKFTGDKKNNTSIENEFIDYFYKKIVDESSSESKGSSKEINSNKKLFIHKASNKIEANNSHHAEAIDYFIPIRNGLGLSGLIPLEQFELKAILNTLTKNEKQSEKYREISYGIMRASTSDGLIYNINRIIKKIYDAEIRRQFNEEWNLFNDYHPFFNGVFSKSTLSKMRDLPPLYAAKPIHRILSSLSSSVTENNESRAIIAEKPIVWIKNIINAIRFRKTMLSVINEVKKQNNSNWFFNVWQPRNILFNNIMTSFEDIPDEALTLDAYFWQINPNDEWHGFDNIAKNYAILDPTKITLMCPGQNVNGEMTDFGIPAMVVVRFMENKLIIPQKSGNYSFLFDISSDSEPEKWKRIIKILLEFKSSYDTNLPLNKIFPTLIKKSSFYTIMGLRDLCEKIHITMVTLNIPILFSQALLVKKSEARSQNHQEEMDNKRAEFVSINKVFNRTIAITVCSNAYNPPFLIPGEIITENNKVIIDYLLALQIFDQTFPGFEHPLQGVWRNTYGEFFIKCLIEI